jgi:hypothetical protein
LLAAAIVTRAGAWRKARRSRATTPPEGFAGGDRGSQHVDGDRGAAVFDDEREDHAGEETLPDTSLHAYGEGREEDIEGDEEKLKSGDAEESQRDEISQGSESGSPEHDKS